MKKWKKLLASMLAIALVLFCVPGYLTVPVQAANKSNIINIKANKTTKVQLDGKGAKEKVKLTVNNKKIKEGDYADNYTSAVILTINGKKVFKNSYNTEWKKPKVELIVTDVKTSDKYKDLFLGVYDNEWARTYQELIRVTYNNGKASTDRLLKTLKSIKSPKIRNKFSDMSRRGYMLNPIESCKGLTKGDLVVSRNGTVKWHVCLHTGTANYFQDYFHGYITLTLKSGKLKAVNYPSGTIVEGGSGKLKKGTTIYKSAGGSKKVTAVPKGKKIKLTEFKYVRKKLYVKVQYGKKSGWASQSVLKALEWDVTLHV